MPENKYGLDSTRPTAEQNFFRREDLDKPTRSFRLRPEESRYLLATKIIAGTLFIGIMAYMAYRIETSGVTLVDKINDRLATYLVDE